MRRAGAVALAARFRAPGPVSPPRAMRSWSAFPRRWWPTMGGECAAARIIAARLWPAWLVRQRHAWSMPYDPMCAGPVRPAMRPAFWREIASACTGRWAPRRDDRSDRKIRTRDVSHGWKFRGEGHARRTADAAGELSLPPQARLLTPPPLGRATHGLANAITTHYTPPHHTRGACA
jgi:hypothetical protein